ncbi:MAG TPA: NAD+ synthase, partial [Actinomycetota bacterium]|nr:NAD+ synthase [Actinomycetota bacterium]
MRTFRLALAQINATVGEFESNTQKVLEGVERARDAHADLVAFPELAIPGYPPEDLLLKPSFVRANERALQKIVPEVRGLVAVVGYAHLDGDLYNAAAVVADGDLKASYHKHFLPTYGVFDEDRYFRRGAEAPIFEIAGTRVGVCICEDIWYPSGPAEWQSWAGAELIVNINGSPFRSGIDEFRRRMLATRAADHVVALGYVNLVGGQDELVFDGASLAFDADGNLLASAPAFEEDLLVVDIDMDGVARERLHDPRMRKVSAPPPEISTPELFISGERAAQRSPITPRFTEQRTQDDDVYKALVLGTRDYVRKNGFRQVFIALSGGIDSALTAAIAVDALGAEAVTGVVMSSKYSSEHSRADAFELGRRLGIEVLDISIQEPHRAMDEELRAHIAQQPGQDLAEQNVQSRIRGLYMMALANARPWSIVLTTGNKSELATGYATLYGDMAGGFAVLKDVPKTLVWRLARLRNRSSEVIPQTIIDKPPSAELKPGQLDQDSLPPYEILDPILEAYVEEDRSLDEIVGAGFDRDTVAAVIRMVDYN